MYNLPVSLKLLIVVLVVWSIIWKIYAAWIACKNNHKKWFVAIIILNTVGIFELVYIFKVARKSWEEVKADFRDAFKNISN